MICNVFLGTKIHKSVFLYFFLEVPIEPRGSRSKRSGVDENNNENEIGDEPLEIKDDLMDSMMDSMLSGETKCKAR